jgi:sporulation-control protein spo0M
VRNLAFRNLTRADMVSLATGQQMVELVAAKVPGITALSEQQIVRGSGGVDLTNIPTDKKTILVNHTPLWFYILREAELNGGRLKGVGGQIVAEVFHRAMAASASSIVREPAWRPTLGRQAGSFDMPDLIFFAFKRDPALISLLG